MTDIWKIIKNLESVVEHTESDLEKAAKKTEFTPQELETVKNIAKIAYYHQILKAMAEEEDRGYSRHYPMYSYAGRKRDSMGRYSRSYRGGYSMDESRDMMMDKLEEAMREAATEHERQAIEQCMSKLM